MTRVINTSNPGKLRDQYRRTIAEALRHLMFKRSVDDEGKDMAATIVLSLRGIAETVESTVSAWEKRDYYLKADRFRLEWEWVTPSASKLYEIISHAGWDELPAELARLAPKFADIRIAKMTRSSDSWKSSYQQLIRGV
ncbi:MAG: hypothetical protein ACYCZF_01495 [Anaerolineae bacterium]